MLKFYNTLTRQKEVFKPLNPKKVTMYSCGPTVYSYAHIGNMRTYLFMDMLRRVLKYNEYKIKGVMNVTDVGHLLSDADDGEDKMAKAAREQKKTPYEIAAFYSKIFFEDLEKLHIDKPEIIAKATEHIEDMINFVQKLEAKGYGYETSDGIYYDISKFKGYGKLSGAKLEDQKPGARVEVNTEKRNYQDFAIWKKAEPEHIMQWPSPWGMGYPGWHIECSAMSIKYLGELFDIHTGGVDHVPIHHENEIAQNEALTGKKTVNYWMHGEFMLVDGGKMSKSLKNTYTITDLEKMGYSPMVFRFFCMNAHYRKKLNFTFSGMDAAKKSYEKLMKILGMHKLSDVKTAPEIIEKYRNEFLDCINDDLNIPLAVGLLFTMLKEPKSRDIYKLALEFDKIFALSFDKAKYIAEVEDLSDIPDEIIEIADNRIEAKKNKNYSLADNLRAKITEKGYNIIDTKDGYTIKKL